MLPLPLFLLEPLANSILACAFGQSLHPYSQLDQLSGLLPLLPNQSINRLNCFIPIAYLPLNLKFLCSFYLLLIRQWRWFLEVSLEGHEGPLNGMDASQQEPFDGVLLFTTGGTVLSQRSPWLRTQEDGGGEHQLTF
jgi:hypothetical protein